MIRLLGACSKTGVEEKAMRKNRTKHLTEQGKLF